MKVTVELETMESVLTRAHFSINKQQQWHTIECIGPLMPNYSLYKSLYTAVISYHNNSDHSMTDNMAEL